MSSSSSESDKSDTEHVTQNQLPINSQAKYMKAYDNFIEWRSERGYNNFSEDVILSYFKDLAKTKQPSTLWATYSMLKATLHTNNDIKIETYYKLTAYLKHMNKGFKSKKSKVFTRSEIETFLRQAPDKDYLVIKAVLIIAVQGGCRGGELLNLRIDDIEKHSDQLLLVKIKDNYKGERSFVIRDEHKDIVEKYMALRPPDAGTDRFFMRYHNGKCFRQVIGKNKFSNMPQEIAAILNLPDPKLYTGHCFRRTAKTLSGDIQVDLPSLRQSEQGNTEAARELSMADPRDNEASVEIDTILNTGPTVAPPKLEVPSRSPTWSSSPSPHPSMFEQHDHEPSPPPQKKARVHDLQTGRIKITESINNTNDTKSNSIPTKNITIIFDNCRNVSNININF